MSKLEFRLPLGVVSQSDIIRLSRELAAVDEFFIAAKARAAGTPVTPPRLTRLLDEISKENQLNLLQANHRQSLAQQLDKLKGSAPTIQISFAAEPPSKFLERILAWLRENIHQHALVQVGLQPSIAAGCVLRTPNKVFDMSLRAHLDKEKAYLVELIKGAVSRGGSQ
ncbi:hypothetical protein A3F65_02430 [Candidatus Saccharibacteria bacterium RIFCSPHIGHO2_12_FULL_47_16b]|nr:MAG: hypothetical protein A3F65_02430 [Candidatus Saccharibacteria bacterium RIFCSPHIGHO2_12_FULL_47_16b]